MKKMIIMAMLVVLAIACRKQEDPQPGVQVEMSATGTGTFEVGWYDHTWDKTWAVDHWSMTVIAHSGDTLRLAAYGNDYAVDIVIGPLGATIVPQGYSLMEYILP